MIDLEKSEKLTPEHRYLNISVLWIFYYRIVLRVLFRLRVPHEIVTLAAIGLGLASAVSFYQGKLILAAILLHLKDVFDACDGALARLTGKGHLIGRYLDSLGDFLVLTSVIAAISARAYLVGTQPSYVFWGVAAVLSVFIQCSFFNFYQIAYVEQYQINSLSSRRDEAGRGDLTSQSHSAPARLVLKILRFAYIIVYSWQDRFVAATDNWLQKPCVTCPKNLWFGTKLLMTLQSPLCFGTHIFIFILFALLGRPQYALVFVATVMNIYLIWVLYYRESYFLKRMPRTEEGTEAIIGRR